VTPCPSCGHEDEAGDRFCSQCGAALVEERTAAGTERKVVTVLAGELRRAADILADIDVPAREAFYRLHAGTAPDVRAALAFYRGVGATRYVHEGEAMLAATA